jgi:colicin import membrane protein
MTMQIQQIPRTAVRTGFRAARLPLTVAETVFRRDDEWLPTRAYETVESRFKQVMGRAVHDDELVEEGILEQAKTLQLGKAATLESQAERERELADASFEEHRKADEEQRERIAKKAEERKRVAQQKRTEEKRQAEAAAVTKASEAQNAQAATEKAIAEQEHQARSAKAQAERDALHEERRALEAEKGVRKADKKVEAAKAARRGSR